MGWLLFSLCGSETVLGLERTRCLQHAEHVKRATLPAAFVTLNFDDGGPRRFDYNDFKENEKRILQHFGHFKGMEYEPRSKSRSWATPRPATFTPPTARTGIAGNSMGSMKRKS
ncbi:hypothetical protein EfsSVR2332_04580 [Enterococcus faecalis]|uniref:Uncharacterized protein n=1 Tax=Enterococcus faecalis TaxID=1351 RepID=A0AC59HL06_ENTFL|nr:hypothetical protein EfsSVR2085_04250 [Enterococcus faecalis]BDQ48717.1 hypothetical protein EfsSVR2281_05280 [Enterococcus faecalis]BDQ59370.1 hypothetical protein EfsSVR2331_34950 [Enterococcus faecalis]BDQ60380.1 hypothetical protein EfsSVR2332_04580 [Enterococcus faecalis]